MNMERVKVETKYVVTIETDRNYKPAYHCLLPDIERAQKTISNGHVLGCVTYGDGKCGLYYNEGGYSKEELKKAGYEIVSELKEIEVYEESKTVYSV